MHYDYNLKFKEHEVFEGKLVEVDESDTPFIWVDEETGKVVSEALTSASTRSKDSYVWVGATTKSKLLDNRSSIY